MVAGLQEIQVERLAILTVIPVAAVLAVSTLLVGGPSLVENFARLDVAALSLLALAAFWQMGFRFLRWMVFARALGVPMRVREGVLFYGAGCGLTLTPGRVGELLRLWLIERRYRIPYRRSIMLYIADRIGDADAYLIMLGLAVALRQDAPGWSWSAFAGIALVNAALLLARPGLRALALLCRLTRRGRRALLWLRRVVRHSASLLKPQLFVPCLGLGLIGWYAGPMVLTLALGRMGVDISLLSASAIYAAAALAGGSTMLPGGGGGTEAAMIVLLRVIDVPLDAAVTATLATRLTFLWGPVAVGFLLLPIALRVARAAPEPRCEPVSSSRRGSR